MIAYTTSPGSLSSCDHLVSSAWASCQIRKIASCTFLGNTGKVFPVTAGERSRHTSRYVRYARGVMHTGAELVASFVGGGKTFPAFQAHAQRAIIRIW